MLRLWANSLRAAGAPFLCAGAVVATVACSGASGLENEAVSEDRAVPMAHVDIEHSRNVGFQSAQASAHFVYSHQAAGGARPFSAVVSGARSTTPEPGRCQDLTGGTLPTSPPVVLLEAGTVVIRTQSAANGEMHADVVDGDVVDGVPKHDVEQNPEGSNLETPEGATDASGPEHQGESVDPTTEAAGYARIRPTRTPVTISLAPRAFPGVSSLASGVVYTSRDREIPLPASAVYQVDIEGSALVPGMSLTGVAPAYLRHVTVGGTPLEQVSSLTSGSPIDLTWDIGDAGDVVIVDVTNPSDGRAVLRCSYSDAAGAGTVPWVAPLADLVVDSARAELHVHRVRLVDADSAGATSAGGGARGQLRFDFALTRDVEFR